MIVYWKEQKQPPKVITVDKYDNPIYEYKEVYGEIVGSMDGGGGTSEQLLIIALPNGKFTSKSYWDCYHKSTIHRDDVPYVN